MTKVDCLKRSRIHNTCFSSALRILHDGQNHLFPDDKISGLRNCLKEVCMPVDTCRGSISRFSSETEEHRQVLQDTVVLSVLEIKLLSPNDTPSHSSKTT